MLKLTIYNSALARNKTVKTNSVDSARRFKQLYAKFHVHSKLRSVWPGHLAVMSDTRGVTGAPDHSSFLKTIKPISTRGPVYAPNIIT